MKKNLLTALLLASCLGFAQTTGIGTTTPNTSARLEISSNNQGVLIPRVALSSTTAAAPVTSPATSLMIYNSATTGDVTPGFYYWDGGKWVKVLNSNEAVAANNIYNSDGTIAANRTVNVNNKLLKFTQGEITTDYINSYRLAQSQYGIFSRNDGTAYYLLPTAQNDPYGTFGNERPLSYFFGSKVTALAQTAAENVGVGTVSPGYKLHVYGTGLFTDKLHVTRDGSNVCCSSDYTFGISENTAVTGKLAKIQFHNSGKQEGFIALSQDAPRRMIFDDDQGAKMGIQVTGPAQIGVIPDGTSTENILTTDANGNVHKIGSANFISSMSEPWQVVGTTNKATDNGQQIYQNARIGVNMGTNSIWNGGGINANGGIRTTKGVPDNDLTAAGFSFENDGDTGMFASGGITSGGSDLIFYNDSANRMTIKNGGNVGIGTDSPAYKLDVNGDVINNGWYRSRGTTGWYNETYGGGWYMGDTTWIRAYNNKWVWTEGVIGSNGGLTIGYSGATPPGGGAIFAGNVGIGTTTPATKLEVIGTVQASAFRQISDQKFKKDVKTLQNGTKIIENLRPVSYHWNEKGLEKGGENKLQDGFIAQEVEKVIPEAVNTDSNGDKSVDYTKVIPFLVKALQESNERIEALEKKLNEKK